MITLNLVGTLTPTRAVVNHLIAQRRGSIVNLSSLAGIIGAVNLADYSAAKGGVVQFTVSLAKELAPFGIRVNSIAPGSVATERIKNLPQDVMQEYISGIRLGRSGTPEELAAAIAFLASPDASYITGQNLNVDGGWGLGPAKF
jgi:NAD(P)-dependent dehydrogenase (short-subunit alcohol dehydrogenase family)